MLGGWRKVIECAEYFPFQVVSIEVLYFMYFWLKFFIVLFIAADFHLYGCHFFSGTTLKSFSGFPRT